MTARDHYDVLGVPRTAGQEEIQRAYRILARRYHPDLNTDPGAAARFREVTEAYEVLSDPARRARYDRTGSARGVGAAAGSGRGQRVHVRTGASWPRGFGEFRRMDIEDPFGSYFLRSRRVPRSRGRDRDVELELSLEDVYTGGRRRVEVGSGSGTQSYDVTIPPGVTDGHRIRLPGGGDWGTGGGPPGDLYLVVRLAPHPRFRLSGRDVTVDVPVAPWEAALGASIPVPTPAGTAHTDLPPGSSSGRRLRLRGYGLPNPRGTPGDLYAEVRIVVPATLTPAERALFAQLAAESRFDPRSDTSGYE
jgi:curved DNA-binding protein